MIEQPEPTDQPQPAPPFAPALTPAPAPAAFNPWAVPGQEQHPGSTAYAPDLLFSPEEPKPRRPRPGPATVLRWTAFALVLAASATATAFAVTALPRHELPGLATPGDGRYSFNQLSLPRLPAGRPAPSATGAGKRHYAQLPALLLQAPQQAPGAAPAAAATCTDYANLHEDSAHLPAVLATNACRDAASRVWTAKDGTRTELWLLRFGSQDEAHLCYAALGATGAVKLVPDEISGVDDFTLAPDQEVFIRTASPAASTDSATDTATGPQPTGKVAYLLAGDVVATIVMTNAAGVPSQPFHQVVALQSDLLG
ncbi:hypothetical protein ACFYNO_38105 [Kitasatospora sp. NPDC006697]|uniref:hypothetical protein n=1 Tax=Kitasatospora sp. NPDC006697 TaxID=3364020 RepID=UPI0036869388